MAAPVAEESPLTPSRLNIMSRSNQGTANAEIRLPAPRNLAGQPIEGGSVGRTVSIPLLANLAPGLVNQIGFAPHTLGRHVVAQYVVRGMLKGITQEKACFLLSQVYD